VDVLTTYCNECSLVSISSSGPAGDLYPGSFGSYATYGSLWENMIPIFKNPSSSHFLTVHPQANPEFYYVPWVLTDRFATDPEDLSHLTVKSQDREGIVCPWDKTGALVWEYKTQDGSWDVDHTITVDCLMTTSKN